MRFSQYTKIILLLNHSLLRLHYMIKQKQNKIKIKEKEKDNNSIAVN